MWLDSHVHLEAFEKEGTLDAVLERAERAGVKRMVAIGGNPDENESVLRIARKRPGQIRAAVGLDRECAGRSDLGQRIEDVRSFLDDRSVVAVGEVGLDFHYRPDTVQAQQNLFRIMATLAHEAGLPLVVHSREADQETETILREALIAGGRTEGIGVLHCFSGSPDFALRLVELGLYISFSGMLTFRKAETIRAAAAVVPPDRILVETDAPFLAPVPHRGKPNEPAWLVPVAEELARLRGWSLNECGQITAENAMRLFSRMQPPNENEGVE